LAATVPKTFVYFVSFKEEYWAPNCKAGDEISVVATLVSFIRHRCHLLVQHGSASDVRDVLIHLHGTY
jgi:hypothetical protein